MITRDQPQLHCATGRSTWRSVELQLEKQTSLYLYGMTGYGHSLIRDAAIELYVAQDDRGI